MPGTSLALLLAWGPYLLSPHAWPGLTGAWVQTVVYVANLCVTARSRRAKRAVVRILQRYAVNPLVRSLLVVGINPLGLVLLETRGRCSGRPRRTPIGNGRTGETLWVIAEHGQRAGYVRNIIADPHVRIRIRTGLRLRWVDGIAELMPEDDAIARQRRIVRWHPLRAFNAMNVRLLGTDLLTVRIGLVPGRSSDPSPQPDPGQLEGRDAGVPVVVGQREPVLGLTGEQRLPLLAVGHDLVVAAADEVPPHHDLLAKRLAHDRRAAPP